MRRFLFAVGIICLLLAGYLTWQRYTPNRLAFDAAVLPSHIEELQVRPTSIEIDDLSLALPIISETMNGKRWPVSDKGVVYLSETPVPGEAGNSILYGHNWPNILGRLTKIKPGTIITVGFTNGERKAFVVEYTQEVTPDQTDILAPTNDSRITLYTCSGFLDSKRFVVTAIEKAS